MMTDEDKLAVVNQYLANLEINQYREFLNGALNGKTIAEAISYLENLKDSLTPVEVVNDGV